MVQSRSSARGAARIRNQIATAVLAIAGFGLAAADAQTYMSVHAFCQQAGCTDGMNPWTTPPAVDISGNAQFSGYLYGTTEQGGDNGEGTLYQLAPAKNGKYTFKRRYSFCQDPPACTNGGLPIGPLVQDASGNLYGITTNGYAYELKTNAGRTTFTFVPLYLFGANGDESKGAIPTGGLTYKGKASGAPYDGTSPLYGMTGQGGANGQGVVFRLKPGKHGWTEDVLYNFCSQAGCTDGEEPTFAVLFVDSVGSLWGSTRYGGAYQGGVVFKLKPGKTLPWKQSFVYGFCSPANNCADGYGPETGVVMDQGGDLFGTTSLTTPNTSGGTVFRLHIAKSGAKVTQIHAFCQTDCRDGAAPIAPVVLDGAGNVYGTTTEAGAAGSGGTVFELVKANKYNLKVLHSFCSQPGCTDGLVPYAPVMIDSSGNLFGTTVGGGTAANAGVVFKLTP